MELMVMCAGVAVVLVFGTAVIVGFAEEVKAQRSERMAPPPQQQKLAPLNKLARSEINIILARHDGREEQLL